MSVPSVLGSQGHVVVDKPVEKWHIAKHEVFAAEKVNQESQSMQSNCLESTLGLGQSAGDHSVDSIISTVLEHHRPLMKNTAQP